MAVLKRAVCLFLFSPVVLCQAQLQPIDDCDYTYVEQPASVVSCNPYTSGFRLGCDVLERLGPATERATLSIEWRRIINFNEEQMIQDGVIAETRGPGVVLGYNLHQSILTIDAEDVDPSSYWCQVCVNGDLLQRSNMLFLSSEEIYPPGACSITEHQSTDTSKCADLPPGSQPTPPPLGTSVQGAMPTVNLQPTTTPLGMGDDPGDDNGSVQQDLYIVVGVVAVFAIIIVTLIVTIVILYRKKVARVSFKTEGELQLGNIETKENIAYGPITACNPQQSDPDAEYEEIPNEAQPHIELQENPAYRSV